MYRIWFLPESWYCKCMIKISQYSGVCSYITTRMLHGWPIYSPWMAQLNNYGPIIKLHTMLPLSSLSTHRSHSTGVHQIMNLDFNFHRFHNHMQRLLTLWTQCRACSAVKTTLENLLGTKDLRIGFFFSLSMEETHHRMTCSYYVNIIIGFKI